MKPNEKDQDEMESLMHYIRYLNSNPDIKDYELWDGIKRMEKFGKKMLEKGFTNEDIDKFFELEQMKELVEKFMVVLYKKNGGQ